MQEKKILLFKLSLQRSPREATGLISNGLPQLNNQNKIWMGGFPLLSNFYVHTSVNKIEAMYEQLGINAKVVQGSTFKVYVQPSIHCLFLNYVPKTYLKLVCDSGNPPLQEQA